MTVRQFGVCVTACALVTTAVSAQGTTDCFPAKNSNETRTMAVFTGSVVGRIRLGR